MQELIAHTVTFFQSMKIEHWLSIFALVISGISAFYTYNANKKHLEVTIEEEPFRIEYFSDEDGIAIYPKSVDSYGFEVAIIKVVNPSVHDIAFFDFVILSEYDTQSNIIPVKKVNCYRRGIEPKFIYGQTSDDQPAQLNLLESSYGIFRSNSFTRLDIAFKPPHEKNFVTIRFKVAIPSRKSVPNSFYRKNYKYYTQKVRINPTDQQSNN